MNNENRPSSLPDWLQKKLHYWFVLYNPLYFFSALCVVFGVFLVSRGLQEMGWILGEILLTCIIEVYEILLLAGAALLFRKAKQSRPAVIIGLLLVLFLFDCTFQTEIIATFGQLGIVLSAAWIAMVAIKVSALLWVFRLKASTTVTIIPVLAAVGIAATPHLLSLANVEKGAIHLISTWFCVGLTGLLIWIRPKINSVVPLDTWGQTVLRRATTSTWLIWGGLYLYHLIVWLGMLDINLSLSHVAPFFLLWVFLSKREIWTWAFGLGAIAATLLNPATAGPTALIAGAVFGLQAYRTRKHRLWVGVVMLLYFACWTVGWQSWPFPEINLWLTVVTGLILLIIGWRLKLPLAFLVAVLSAPLGLKTLGLNRPLEWGILLLIIGFIALFTGVAINMRQRPVKED